MNHAAFVLANTRLLSPPFLPELRLHLAEQSLPIWQTSQDELGHLNVPLPFWAFAWAGGQALARYLLDHRTVVAGRCVLDLGCGSGLVGIAARLAGARRVLAADIDATALAATALNAAENGVSLDTIGDDMLDGGPAAAFEVLLVGDMFYEPAMAAAVLALIDAASANGATVLLGDPRRSYFPTQRFEPVAEYQVPVSRELEDSDLKPTTVWRPRRNRDSRASPVLDPK